MIARPFIDLCREASQEIWGSQPPNARYAKDTARLLALTAAAESRFLYRRQTVFDWSKDVGGWGIWQTEQGIVADTAKFLARKPDLLRRVTTFVCQTEKSDPQWLLEFWRDTPNFLRVLSFCDRLAVAQCRLDYMQHPEPIPHGLRAQAKYWKDTYNTHKGAGTVEGAMDAYETLVEPLLSSRDWQ